MPIAPENRARYPSDWKAISARVRFERAGGRCECEGECGVDHAGRCLAEHGKQNPMTGSLVVLTVAHLDHTPENCDDGNLKAMCERAGLNWQPIAELGTEKRCVFVTGPDDWPSVEVYNMPPFVNNAGRLVAFSQNSANMGSMHWVTHFAEMGEGPLPATGEMGRG